MGGIALLLMPSTRLSAAALDFLAFLFWDDIALMSSASAAALDHLPLSPLAFLPPRTLLAAISLFRRSDWALVVVVVFKREEALATGTDVDMIQAAGSLNMIARSRE
jgi:hypothetical protein